MKTKQKPLSPGAKLAKRKFQDMTDMSPEKRAQFIELFNAVSPGAITRWRPIGTAPKDRTRILAYGTGTDKLVWSLDEPKPPMQCVIYWDWIDGDKDEDVGGGLFRKVPCRYGEGWRPIGGHWFTPTHWMPLPMPPCQP